MTPQARVAHRPGAADRSHRGARAAAARDTRRTGASCSVIGCANTCCFVIGDSACKGAAPGSAAGVYAPSVRIKSSQIDVINGVGTDCAPRPKSLPAEVTLVRAGTMRASSAAGADEAWSSSGSGTQQRAGHGRIVSNRLRGSDSPMQSGYGLCRAKRQPSHSYPLAETIRLPSPPCCRRGMPQNQTRLR